jgi:hypothetical protein
MASLSFVTIFLLFGVLLYVIFSLYIIGMFLRPPLTKAINGLVEFALKAFDVGTIRINTAPGSGDNAAH